MITAAGVGTAIDLKTNSCWNTVIDSLVLNLIPHIVSDFLLFNRIEVEKKFSSNLFPSFEIYNSNFSRVKRGMRDVLTFLMFF